MIKRLRLVNWKAYSNLDLEIPSGTTFFIARNGIGKTSIIQAIAWGLFGTGNVSFDPRDAVRTGAEKAEVEIDITTSGGRSATISRTVSRGSAAPTVEMKSDTAEALGEEAVAHLIAEEVGADPSFLARLSVFPEGSVSTEVKRTVAADVFEHLSQVFGVADLRAASVGAQRARATAKRATLNLRQLEASETGLRTSLETRLSSLSEQAVAAQTEFDAQKDVVAARERAYDDAREWSTYRTALSKFDESSQQIRTSLEPLVTTEGFTFQQILLAVEDAETAARARHGTTRMKVATLRARSQALEEFVSGLTVDSTECPLCLRSIEGPEAAHAANAHASQIAQFAADLLDLEKVADQERDAVDVLSGAHRSLARMSAPPAPSSDELPLDESQGELEEARKALDTLVERKASIQADIKSTTGDLEEHDARDRAHRDAERSYRLEALSEAVEETFKRAADAIVSERLEPITQQLSSRWKSFWAGSHGLHLSAAGTLSLERGDRRIPWAHMSGGERVIGLLMVRLVAMAMTTRSRFLLLDEPLEHLDPRNRRMVSSMLVQASGPEQFDQILVTTYEEPVARRLADHSPNANVQYLTPDPV